jgi:subtilisin family serine protease
MTNRLGFTLRPDQWHLLNEGQTGGTPGMDINVVPVWADYTGKGVRVAVFDSGIDATHPDLIGNYLPEFAYDFWNETTDASYLHQPEYDPHGTMVAGFIAATGQGIGLRGVAYDAKLTAYANFNGKQAYTAFGKAADAGFDVMNNSWGTNIPFIYSFSNDTSKVDNIEYAAQTGRDGLGLNIVFAAGNEYKLPRELRDLGYEWSGEFSYADANADNNAASRFTITVAALDHNGTYNAKDSSDLGYTTPGAPVLVSAPGSDVVSTDIQGEHGYNPGEIFAHQYGTSFAAPIVTGVVALMLEANPSLGYRDVQEILAYSARLIDLKDESWQLNGAVDANGGGLWTNDNYGFGLVDATAAVRLAETWQKQSHYANEAKTAKDAGITKEVAIPDGGEVTFNFTLQPGIRIENIELEFAIQHEEFGDLIVILTSPSGTQSTLLYRTGDARASELTVASLVARGFDVKRADFTELEHTLSSNDFWSEDSGGVWKLQIADAKEGNVGAVHGLELRAFGSAVTDNKTYIYTNDYALLAQQDATRKVLDNASGIHTLNLSAVTDAIVIDLDKGTGTVAGQKLSISAQTKVGMVYSGDGDDYIVMADGGTWLDTGRGNDTVSASGQAGVDGGTGFDRAIFELGKSSYSIKWANGAVTLDEKEGDSLVLAGNVEFFTFADDILIVVDDAVEAQVARLYDLLLGRGADYEGLAYWIDALDNGVGVHDIAGGFAFSNEYIDLGAELSHDQFLTLLYVQTLGREAEAAGVDYWVDQLEAGMARGTVATSFALSDEANSLTFDHVVLVAHTPAFTIV